MGADNVCLLKCCNCVAASGRVNCTWRLSAAGQLVGAEPADACLPLMHDMKGAVALVGRGTCSFVEKALNVQNAGAAAMVVVNHMKSEQPFAMGHDQSAATLHITAVMVTEEAGHSLHAALQDAAEPCFASIQAAGQRSHDKSEELDVTVEHQVYVPEATQSWLQIAYANHEGQQAQDWQTAVTQLMTSVQGQLHEVLSHSLSP